MALSKQMKHPLDLPKVIIASRIRHGQRQTFKQRQHFEQARPLQNIDDATKLMRGDK